MSDEMVFFVGARGKRGLCVTVPAKWAKKHGLKVGDPLSVTVKRGSLVIKVLKKEENDE